MFERSIQRAETLLGPQGRSTALLVKLVDGDCHCFDHWPETWDSVNRHLADTGQGSIVNEGDVLVSSDGAQVVLQCHESGPETVAFLNAATAVASLAAAVVALVTTIVAARRKETTGRLHTIHLKVFELKPGSPSGPTLTEFFLTADGDDAEQIRRAIETTLRSRT